MDQGSFLKVSELKYSILFLFEGALIFCVLLNFKHIYLYYAPAFVAFYLINYFEIKYKFDLMLIMKRGNSCFFITGIFFSLGSNLFGVMLVPFLISFAPFLWMTGLDGVKQILLRLFPVQRGKFASKSVLNGF